MNSFLRHAARHVRHNLIAYLALFVALSGSAIAAKPLAGDITAVIAGSGLSGGGTEGDVTLGLSSTGCAAGAVWTWTGSAWSCSAPTPSGLAFVYFVTGAGITIQPGDSGMAQAYCSSSFRQLNSPNGPITKGHTVLGGGSEVNPSPGSGQPAEYNVVYSRPFYFDDGSGNRSAYWEVNVKNLGAGPIDVATSAVCGRLD